MSADLFFLLQGFTSLVYTNAVNVRLLFLFFQDYYDADKMRIRQFDIL